MQHSPSIYLSLLRCDPCSYTFMSLQIHYNLLSASVCKVLPVISDLVKSVGLLSSTSLDEGGDCVKNT